jgi:hypothetical protein
MALKPKIILNRSSECLNWKVRKMFSGREEFF